MENKPVKQNSFHLAGIVPVAGRKLDFNMPWHDSLMPIGQNYLAVERAVQECAFVGCETIWVVCHDDMQPLIRYRLGDYINDPRYIGHHRRDPMYLVRPIPIYYAPILPRDINRKDCLAWSVLHGAWSAYKVGRELSKWITPDKYYVSFPYGIYPFNTLFSVRKVISSKKHFAMTYEGKSVKDNLYLPFTFDGEMYKECRHIVFRESTYKHDKDRKELPPEKKWSARWFKLDRIFRNVNIEESVVYEVPWYYGIDNWEGYCEFISSEHRQLVTRPRKEEMAYHEWNPIAVDAEDIERYK